VKRLFAGAALVATWATLPALAQPSFTGVGDLPGGRVFSECVALSRDGSVAFGDSATQFFDPINAITSACQYTHSGGLQWLDPSYPNISTFAYAANQDGTVAAGYAIIVPPYADIEIFRWTASGGIQILGDIAGGATNSTARGISADGNIIVGFGSSAASTALCGICQEAFKWTADTGIVGLGDLPGGNLDSRAYAISGNGGVIVGAGTSAVGVAPTTWDDTGIHNLGYLPQGGFAAQGWCNAVNYDGSVIVGVSSSVNGATEAFRWSASGGGTMIGLGDLPGGPFQSQAWAVSDDGQIVVGQATVEGGLLGAGQSVAFIWDAAHGIRDLKQVLTGAGLNLSNWLLTSARAISADGRVIAGIGINPNGDGEGWIATLPRCGSADFNCDGAVATDADIEAFFSCLSGSCPPPPCTSSADFNGDGAAATDADIEAFFRVLAGESC
jgi:probable HAF family extracellular repeat protein